MSKVANVARSAKIIIKRKSTGSPLGQFATSTVLTQGRDGGLRDKDNFLDREHADLILEELDAM